MGFTPAQVGAMSLWQFWACLDGFAKANGAEDKPTAPTAAEHADRVRRLG